MKHSAIILPILIALFSLQTQAQIIFSQDFDNLNGPTTDLNGTTPDTNNGGATWVATSIFDVNGNVNATDLSGTADSGRGSATLAFTPVDGFIYTLDVSLGAFIDGGNNWFAIGFGAGQSTAQAANNRFLTNDLIGKAWMFNRSDDADTANVAWLGDASTGNSDGADWTTDANTFGGEMDLRIVLNTEGGENNWTATWFADTGSGFNTVRATTTLLDETINSVGFAVADDTLTGSVTSFSLTAVPEPSVFALIAGCLGLSWVMIRRRQS